MEAPCQKILIWSSWDQLKIYVAFTSQRPFYHDIKNRSCNVFFCSIFSKELASEVKNFFLISYSYFLFFFISHYCSLILFLWFDKFFKFFVIHLFFQLTIHIFLLFFKLLSFRGPILAEIKTLKNFKTEKEFESDWVSSKWRKVFANKKVDKKKVIQELLMTTILHKNVRIIVCLSQRICDLLIAVI